MNKPTVFFSHSSGDKKALRNIRDRFCEITGDTINVFMSSDGQSIPFGRNWVHKVDKGLNDAKIMFAFISTNSITSNWIYFEAGYAYSKGIRIIPIGLGLDITTLSPPLGLLQGFNLNSHDSLNNLVAVVNKEFGYSFKESFDQNDFNSLSRELTEYSGIIEIQSVFSEIYLVIHALFVGEEPKPPKSDIEIIFDGFRDLLNADKIPFASTKLSDKASSILVSGLNIVMNCNSGIKIEISPLNMITSLELLNKLLATANMGDTFYLTFIAKRNVLFVNKCEMLSSIIYKNLDKFQVLPDIAHYYGYKSLKFCIMTYDIDGMCVDVYYNLKTVELLDFVSLVDAFAQVGILEFH